MLPDQIFEIWAADARARGNFPTVFPTGYRAGYKAERTPDGDYLAPPIEVQEVEDAVRLQERQDIAAGERIAALERALGVASQWVLRLPRRVVEGVFGIPPWVIPLGAVVLAVFLAREWGRRPETR